MTTLSLIDYWNPLTRIQDAWMLVEKLRKDGYFVCIQGGDESVKGWWVCIADNEGSLSAEADDECEAICTAIERLITERG